MIEAPMGPSGQIMQAARPGTVQNVSYDTSTQSSAFGANTTMVRLVATTDAHVAFGSNPTATTSSLRLVAFTPEYFLVDPSTKIAAIKNATAGTLNVTEFGQLV